ncbi:mechanosensitive ion channel family protein [Streptosporangium sp. NBC_01755]|uniref:mechanosensitive ion channel family protein n=1 Tax=unclassified Streptosporangium TaxID=2632669 RepID=UPI002DD8A842|nr:MULTISPECIES: mechanosensitive ion channel family protein [unclassified Streptosporangium]WSA26996.1 mechanosensitive ion channel family protein [Streptosporangium sp. NBC_01810]WSD01592.1 mechanosensitive ion channel family protein [Streptosporangium sp. NBC_01755]
MFLLSPTPIPSPSPTPSTTPSTSVTPTPGPGVVVEELIDMSAGLTKGCGNGGGMICDFVQMIVPVSWAAPVIAGMIAIALVVIIALLLRNVAHRLISRVVRKASAERASLAGRLRGREAVTPEGLDAIVAERRRQRAETIGSVLKPVASIIILGTAVLTVLDRLSVPIAPLLTSVGILGVAVGFGAQELVKDFIAGMFMLLEDQYGVGDVIDAGTAIGTVEAVTLRITRLRDSDGRVWYIRNGTITRVGNASQGWSRATVDVPVAYASDIPVVRDLLKQVADEMWNDLAFRDSIIVEEPQVWGIEQISETAVIFRVSVKTIPSRQAEVARELRIRVKSALDHAEIPIAG